MIHVERKSRYPLAGKATADTATSFNNVSLHLFQQILGKYRKTLTADKGNKNTGFSELGDKFMLRVCTLQNHPKLGKRYQ